MHVTDEVSSWIGSKEQAAGLSCERSRCTLNTDERTDSATARVTYCHPRDKADHDFHQECSSEARAVDEVTLRCYSNRS